MRSAQRRSAIISERGEVLDGKMLLRSVGLCRTVDEAGAKALNRSSGSMSTSSTWSAIIERRGRGCARARRRR